MQPSTYAFPAGMSEAMKNAFKQRMGDNYAFCYGCNSLVMQGFECIQCQPPKTFSNIIAHYHMEIGKEHAKEAAAITAMNTTPAATNAANTATPTVTITTAINNLFNQHINSAIANEAAHWAVVNSAGVSVDQLKKDLHDHYVTLNGNNAKSTWLNRVRDKANDQEKLDAVMDMINNP